MAATVTTNVSGVSALRLIIADTTTLYFTNAVDGQRLTLTLQQDATGSRTVVSGNCPGIIQPSSAAGADTTQVLEYDSYNNTWNQIPNSVSTGCMVLNTTTTSESISWTRGLFGISGGGAVTLTITNPVSGPPGVGNDGEVMYFVNLTAQAHVITMATGTTVNGSSTTITTNAAIGNSVALMAFGGKVYVIGSRGTITYT